MTEDDLTNISDDINDEKILSCVETIEERIANDNVYVLSESHHNSA